MTLYELLLFVHVLAAATWVGGAVMLKVLSDRALKADPDRAAELAVETEKVGSSVLMPASIVLLVAGLWMVFEGDWGFEPLWVKLGLGIYLVSAVAGAVFLGPLYKQTGELRAERGPGDAEVTARLQRISKLSWIDLGLLVAAIFVMTVKP
jgi:putative copper export protein